MTTITVKETKNHLQHPDFTLCIDNKQCGFSHDSSRKLTNTCYEDGDGIFDTDNAVVRFKCQDTWVTVDFGAEWSITSYSDPAQEIKRRVQLVKREFEAVSTSYEKVWTENLDENNEYIEKRKAEAAQATHYFQDGKTYEVDNSYEEDGDGNLGFRIAGFNYHDDTLFISFSDVPQEAYFLKLTRIE